MTCRELEGFLYPYLDGEFEPHEQLEFERHVAGCLECAKKVHAEAGFQESVRRTRQVSVSNAPEHLRHNIQLGLDRQHRRTVLGSWIKISAAAMVLAGAGGSYWAFRSGPRVRFIEDAALRHSKALPMEIQEISPEHFEAWFAGKLDHRVAVPQLPNATLAGARLSNVREKPAAYIAYTSVSNPGAPPRRIGLFVFDDEKGEVGATSLPAVEMNTSHGYNVVMWRDHEIVYELVTDLDEANIRQMVNGIGSHPRAKERPPSVPAQPASVQR